MKLDIEKLTVEHVLKARSRFHFSRQHDPREPYPFTKWDKLFFCQFVEIMTGKEPKIEFDPLESTPHVKVNNQSKKHAYNVIQDRLSVAGLRMDKEEMSDVGRTLNSPDVLSLPFLQYKAIVDTFAKDDDKELMEAKAYADDRNWPELSGTPAQVKWALKIRYKAHQKYGEHPSFMKATTAKFWIDNREKWSKASKTP